MKVRAFRPEDEGAVIALWDACALTRPWNDPARDIARKLDVQPELFLVGMVADAVVASVMAGFDGHRGWLYYLAVAPDHRQRGHARALVDHAERLLIERGCPKINLLVRASNGSVVDFYKRLGYRNDSVICLGRRLIHDGAPQVEEDPLAPAVRAMWSDYLQAAPRDAGQRFWGAFHFTDNAKGADELAALIVSGAKRAAASLLWGYEADHEPLPYPGALAIVTDWNGAPCCVIETRRVEIVAFEDVDPMFAETEGEGDGSLRWWREAHWKFFTRECARIGREPTTRMPVVCERFEVVHPRDPRREAAR